MGLLARIFGVYTPDERIARARAYLETGEPNEARLEVEELDHPEAAVVLAAAHAALVSLNLEEAEARFTSDDDEGGKEHMEMARAFGATSDQLREVRKVARELRAQERKLRKAQQQEAELIEPEGNDPLWSLPPDDPRVRFAMLVEGYPAELRERLAKLGKEFAAGVLLLEDGQAGRAFEVLSKFVEQEPAARFERARAAMAGGQIARAASDLATVGDTFGHQRIGPMHTGVTLAQLLVRMDRHQDALDLCDTELQKGGDELSWMATRAQILHGLGRLDEAETATTTALRKAPKDLGLFRLLGMVRTQKGDRMGAMQALEAGMRVNNCSNPMKCGFKPPDVPSIRLLARLYLEDRLDDVRARELVGMLQGMVQQPTWDDAYVAALLARNEGGDTGPMVDQLRTSLKPGDPRMALVDQQFAKQLAG